jgi:pimeloyl-ACP methyl ester carboxylesterase
MGTYVELGPVTTWYEELGEGEPLVLLHGRLVDARFFSRTLPPLAEHFHVYLPERRGHGHSPDVDGPLSYQVITDDTIAFLDSVVGRAADLVGHGDGGFVALRVALQRPDLVRRLVMISSGIDRSGDAAPNMPVDVDQVVAFLGPAYAEVSPDGAEHFPVLVQKIAAMVASEPGLDKAELPKVGQRSLIMLADDDEVTLRHAVEMYDAMPYAELAVMPGTSHFLVQEKPDLVNAVLVDFLTQEPVTPVIPIRRANGPAG